MVGSGEAPARGFSVRVLGPGSAARVARAGVDLGDPSGAGGRGGSVRIIVRGLPRGASSELTDRLLRLRRDVPSPHRNADPSDDDGELLLVATLDECRKLLPLLRGAPFGFDALADELEAALGNVADRGPRRVAGAHRSFTVGDRTLVMGVLNVTPDSFSDGGRFLMPEEAIAQARRMVAEGAAVIDIGGESTRPGAAPVSEEEEWRRIRPVLAALAADDAVVISVDTRHPGVAERAVDAGADLINDVSGLTDPGMREVVARTGAAAVLMHLRGTPARMQEDTAYRDLRAEVFDSLSRGAAAAERDGVERSKILLDPGLGFAKTAAQSLELLQHVGELRSLGYPLVVGASRKSFLGALGGGASPSDRLEASLAAAVIAALEGTEVIRSHEVAPTLRALSVVDALRRSGSAP